MLVVNSTVSIDENELVFDFVRASGPGGQNVNKVATGVQLRFDVKNSSSLPEEMRQRLMRLAGKRLTEDGVLVVDAHRFRTQEQNRQDALDRLAALARQAAEKPRPRRKTRPTAASVEKRLEAKRRRSQNKRLRSGIDE